MSRPAGRCAATSRSRSSGLSRPSSPSPRRRSRSESRPPRRRRALIVGDALRITAVDTRTYRIALVPPFRAAWDPVPRATFEATLVVVSTDAGITGYASGGDGLPDREALERLLLGVAPRRGEHVREVCETIDFHGGRPWAVEVACWDIAGKAAGEPLWRLLGGRADRIGAYASSGELAGPDERAARAKRLAEGGGGGTKNRLPPPHRPHAQAGNTPVPAAPGGLPRAV